MNESKLPLHDRLVTLLRSHRTSHDDTGVEQGSLVMPTCGEEDVSSTPCSACSTVATFDTALEARAKRALQVGSQHSGAFYEGIQAAADFILNNADDDKEFA